MSYRSAVPADEAAITRAAAILREGGLVAFPTETVYGLGAHALDELAVAKVFEAKGRPRFDPLIVHIPTVEEAADLVTEFPGLARDLARQFWPGPLTLVLPKRSHIPDLVTAGAGTVAVRVPDHPVAQLLLRQSGVPVAAPSANPFGRISPTTAQHVAEQLGDRVDLILDGGPCRVGIESTVVQVIGQQASLLRPGGVPLEELERVCGPVASGAPVSAGLPLSPGTLPQHYAPATPLAIAASAQDAIRLAESDGGRVGLLTFSRPDDVSAFEVVENLSPSGDLKEAAAGFFAALRRLDSAGLCQIVAIAFPEVGLGRAINDRLNRARSGTRGS